MPGDFTVHQRVRFQGVEYWWHNHLISPLEHFDAAGNPTMNPLRDLSYAVITKEGEIMRYRQVIGRVEDLEVVKVVPSL